MNAWEFLNKMATFSSAVCHFARRSVFQKVRALSLGSLSHTSVAVVGTTVLETQEPSVMFQMRPRCIPMKTYLPDSREKYFRRRCIYCITESISEHPCLFLFLPWFLWFCGFQVLRYIEGSLSEKCVACENIRFSSLFADGDVSRGGTSATQRHKFHNDDVTSVRNPVRSADWLMD